MNPRHLFSIALASIALVALAQAETADRAPPLRVCMAEDNAPFSSEAAGGVDPVVAEELGRRLDRPVRTEWVRIPERGGLGKALNQALRSGRCEVFAGVPTDGEEGASLAERHLVASEPYLTVGYVLVRAPGSHIGNRQDLDHARLGAVTATPADLYVFREHLQRQPYGDNASLLHAVKTGEVDAAILWGPALARLVSAGATLWPGAVVSGVRFDPDMLAHFTMVVPADRDALRHDINQALTAMRSEGVIARAGAQFGLPAAGP